VSFLLDCAEVHIRSLSPPGESELRSFSPTVRRSPPPLARDESPFLPLVRAVEWRLFRGSFLFAGSRKRMTLPLSLESPPP